MNDLWGRVAGYAIFSAVLGGIATGLGRRKARALLRGDRAALASIPIVPSDLEGSCPECDPGLEREAARVAASEGWEAAADVFGKEAFRLRQYKSRRKYLMRRYSACMKVQGGIMNHIYLWIWLAWIIGLACVLLAGRLSPAH